MVVVVNNWNGSLISHSLFSGLTGPPVTPSWPLPTVELAERLMGHVSELW
jgi:hypothetical protein